MIVVATRVGECHVSNDADVALIAYGIGSCIALAIHDPVAGVGGLLHFMLPDSALDPKKAGVNPYLFPDTGIPLMLRMARLAGADKSRLSVTAAGGAQMLDGGTTFNIGPRNILALKKALWKAGILLSAEHLGGTVSRTVRLEIRSGRVQLEQASCREPDRTAPRLVWKRR